MKLTVKGVPGAPHALLIHPAMTDASYFDPLMDALCGKYRLAIPTLDGHYADAPDFTSAHDQAERLMFKLHAEHIDHINVMLCCGLGACVGLALLAAAPGLVRLSVFDGAHLDDSALREREYLHRLRMVAKVGLRNPVKARRRVDTRDERYASLFVDVAKHASGATLVNVAHAACRAALPELPAHVQSFMTFTWGGYDETGSCHARVARAYPAASFVIKERHGTNGFLLGDPDGFARRFLQ